MTKSEAQREIKRLRKGISAKFGSYKLVRVNGPVGEWGIKFTPKSKARRTSVYRG